MKEKLQQQFEQKLIEIKQAYIDYASFCVAEKYSADGRIDELPIALEQLESYIGGFEATHFLLYVEELDLNKYDGVVYRDILKKSIDILS